MAMRSRSDTVAFRHCFTLKGIDRPLPPGLYSVVTDEMLIEELSFTAWRRVSTLMLVPALHGSSIEMVRIEPHDLAAAQEQDRKLE